MSIKFYFYKIKSTKIRTKDSNKYLTVSFVRTISESFSNIARSQFKTGIYDSEYSEKIYHNWKRYS